MKKVVLTFGAISGGICVAMFVISTLFIKKYGFESMGGLAEVFGYASIIVAMTFIFVGIHSYRKNYNDGIITFGKAFQVGLLISLVSSLIYVVAWEIEYSVFFPDFMEQYAANAIEKLKSSGASQEKMDETMKQMAHYKDMYSNMFTRAALTFLEPFSIALPVTLIAALILKRKTKKEAIA